MAAVRPNGLDKGSHSATHPRSSRSSRSAPNSSPCESSKVIITVQHIAHMAHDGIFEPLEVILKVQGELGTYFIDLLVRENEGARLEDFSP